MLRIFAVIIGIAFIFAGVAGFLPSFMKDGMLFGYLEVNSIHSIVYIISGVIAIMSATSYRYTRLYFMIFGILYGLAAIAGFVRGGDLFMLHVNLADNILHTVIAAVFLYVGFSARKA